MAGRAAAGGYGDERAAMTRKVKTVLTLYGVFVFALFFSAMAYVTVAGPGMPLVAWFTLLIVSTSAAAWWAVTAGSESDE